MALPLLSSLRIDSQALGWTVLVAVFTAMIFGLLPGLRMASGNLQEMLKDSGPGAGLGRKHERIRAVTGDLRDRAGLRAAGKCGLVAAQLPQGA